jgi:hypothetical protein
MFLPLLLAIAQPEPKMLLTCEQFEWLVERTVRTESLSSWKKIEFIARFADGTDPACFPEVEE